MASEPSSGDICVFVKYSGAVILRLVVCTFSLYTVYESLHLHLVNEHRQSENTL